MGSSHPILRRKRSAAWVIIVVALGLNFWFDYYLPTGWLLDVPFVVYVVIKLYCLESECESPKRHAETAGPTENGTRSGNS